jgi:hypothetical protein
METVKYNGWNCVRLANGVVEAIVTKDVGPRVIRFGFVGGRNLMAEYAGQQGGMGEKDWMIRGGHRLWVAPEEKPKTYELDNEPIEVKPIPGGVRTVQPVGPLSGVQKIMDITLAPKRNEVKIIHTLRNQGKRTLCLAPWALTVMAPDGMAIIPLPKRIAHTDRLTHNQEWSLWGYTDFSDPRWTLGARYVFFRQNRRRGPNKLGIAHREGWVGYQLGEFLFVKQFAWKDGCCYPDGGVNFETFSNEDMLEVESLGPIVDLAPGKSVKHEETWNLYRKVKSVRTEADADKYVLPLVRG